MLRRIVFNSGVMLGGQVVVKLLGLFWLAVVARHLGDERFGYLTYAFSLAALLGVLVEFGLSPVITRAVARDPAQSQEYLTNALGIRLLLSAISIPLTVLVALRTGATSGTLEPVYIAAAAAAVAGLYAVSSSIFFGREKMEFPSMIMVGTKLLAIAAGLGAVRAGAGLVWIAMIFLLEPVLNLVISIPVVRRQLGLRFVPRLNVRFCSRMVREALPFAMALALGLVYFRIDVVMLSAMKGNQCVGWYSAGYRLLEGLVYLPAAFINTVFPTLSRLKATSEDLLRTTAARSWEFVIAIALPMALGLALLSEGIVDTLYGEEYVQTASVLRWIGAGLLFVFVNNLLGVLLGAIDRQRVHFYCALATVVLNVALNFWWIPRYAHLGAARATFLAQIVLMVLLSSMVARFTGVRLSYRRLAKMGGAGGTMAAVLLLTKGLSLIPAIVAGGGAYLAVLLLTGTITTEEWKQLRGVIVFRRGLTTGDGADGDV